MIAIQYNTSWYSVDGMTAAEWLANIGGMPEGVRFVLDDGEPLAAKIREYIWFDVVVDGTGILIDVTPIDPPEPPLPPEPGDVMTNEEITTFIKIMLGVE